MGYGPSITTDSFKSFKKDRGISGQSTFKNVYKSSHVKREYLPYNVNRESRDSIEHPMSTPLIFGLDSTGSMGMIYEIIAKKFETAVIEIFNRQCVPDPQIMFAAIDDVEARGIDPLQVTQFEVDNRIAEQLFDLYFTGCGCGNGFESYQLLWYFAAMHTKTDCVEKHNKKGVLITVGDDGPQYTLKRDDIKRVFGDTIERDYTANELLEMVSRQYDVYHICVEQGSSFRRGDVTKWEELLGNRVITLKDANKLPELLVSLLEVNAGNSVNTALQNWDGSTQLVVGEALKGLVPANKNNDIVVF